MLVAVLVLVALPLAVEAQKQCRTGKPCGNACIAADKVCRVGAVSATTAEPAITEYPWVASSRGKVYYRRQCNNAKELARENRRYFATEEAGYTRSKSKGC